MASDLGQITSMKMKIHTWKNLGIVYRVEEVPRTVWSGNSSNLVFCHLLSTFCLGYGLTPLEVSFSLVAPGDKFGLGWLIYVWIEIF